MTDAKKLREALLLERKNGYDVISVELSQQMEAYCQGYMDYLDKGRTERLCVRETVALAEAEGFTPYEPNQSLKAGDKIYHVNRDKSVFLAVIGSRPLSEGVVIGASHIDSPRLDLKPYPLVENSDFCLLKTHYYGGIRKYQWASSPLMLSGVVIKADGSRVEVEIGREPGDPVLTIPDLLPHLAARQSQKPLHSGIEGEQLNLLAGSHPYPGEGKDRIKLMVMALLNEKYGIVESDLLSAELSAVPIHPVREVGLDRSMIGGYGQDDRVCAYATLKALFDAAGERTMVCVLADKEEIGSVGISGMDSQAFEYFMEMLCDAQGVKLSHCFAKSFCLSTDVTAGYDPNCADVYEKNNSAMLNQGIGLCKYTGSRGKSAGSDANAETVAWVRQKLEAAGVLWQMAELGKVDEGGGGTVAQFMAHRDIDTLDAGTPVLAMHAPFEVTSKLDCFMTYLAMKAVFEG